MSIAALVLGFSNQCDVTFAKGLLHNFEVNVFDLEIDTGIEDDTASLINMIIDGIFRLAIYEAEKELCLDLEEGTHYNIYTNCTDSRLYVNGEPVHSYEELLEAFQSLKEEDEDEDEE